jgi:hypothetical protein
VTASRILPIDFYVYLHRKATTGEVFYVGKGIKDRAWTRTGRSNLWQRTAKKHGLIVEIVQDGLQDWAAMELEFYLIALYGRKDLSYGPLVNLCDGQIGVDGFLHDHQTKARIANGVAKIWQCQDYQSKVRQGLQAVYQSAEARKSLSEQAKAVWKCDDYRLKKKEATQRYWSDPAKRQKQSLARRGKGKGARDLTQYGFESFDGDFFTGTIYEAQKFFQMPYGSVWQLAHGIIKYSGNWFLAGLQPIKGQRAPRNLKIYHVLNIKTGRQEWSLQRDMPVKLGINSDMAYSLVKKTALCVGGWVLKETKLDELHPIKRKKYLQWFAKTALES